MKSAGLRDAAELWFEYLNLARQSLRDDVQVALKGSAPFYVRWGDTVNVPFDQWWKTHSWLFADRVLRIRGSDEPDSDDEEFAPHPSMEDLLLFIPLTRSQDKLKKEVAAFISRQITRLKWSGHVSLRPRLTEGVQLKPMALKNKLIVYRDVFLKHPGVIGRQLLEEVHTFYERQGRKSPNALLPDLDGDIQRPLRNLLRYIDDAEEIMMNVANRKFPGPRGKKKVTIHGPNRD